MREKVSVRQLRQLIDQALHAASGHHVVPPAIVPVRNQSPNWQLAPDTPEWIKQAVEPLRTTYDLADPDSSLTKQPRPDG